MFAKTRTLHGVPLLAQLSKARSVPKSASKAAAENPAANSDNPACARAWPGPCDRPRPKSPAAPPVRAVECSGAEQGVGPQGRPPAV